MLENNRKLPFWWSILPILLLVAYLGIRLINYAAMWGDEWLTYYTTGGGPLDPISLVQVIRNATIFQSWPPGYLVIFAGWTNFIGGLAFSDRYLSLLFSLLTVAAMYRLGSIWHSRMMGLLAALIVATTAFFMYYTHELRPYTLYAFSVTVNAWLYWRLIKKPRAGRAVGWTFALSIGLSLYVHYTAALCVFAIGAYHVLFERPRNSAGRKLNVALGATTNHRTWMRVLRLWMNGCLLFTPWIAVAMVNLYNESLARAGLPLSEMLYNILFAYTNGFIWLPILLLLTLRYIHQREIRFVWMSLVVVMVLTIIVNGYADFLFHPRHVMGIFPMIVLLWAYTLFIIGQNQRALAAVLLGIWVGVGINYSFAPSNFMSQISSQLSGIPNTANNTILETAASCIAPDDLAVYGISKSVDVDAFDIPLNNYLANVPFEYVHLASIVADVADPSDLQPETFFENSHAERLAILTENVQTVWVFVVQNLRLHREQQELNSLLVQAGYSYCGAIVDRPDLFGAVYTQEVGMCQQLITSCAGN